jgi:hypothetical protein
MKKIPTAEEYANSIYQEYPVSKEIHELMIGFAKMHVTAALKQAAHESQCYNKAKFPGDENWVVDIDSILDSYPLENIK